MLQCRIMASHKRIQGNKGNGPTRRNLFGPVDREQLQREYQAALRRDVEEASHRWGFDFLLEKPMESNDFQWECVPGAKVPPLYRSCMLDVDQLEKPEKPEKPAEAAVKPAEAAVKPKKRRLESAESEKENVPCSPERCPIKLEDWEKTPEKRGSTGLKRKQTNITGTNLKGFE